MKKIIIIILVILIILSAIGLTYLNNVVLPKTVKGLIIKAIEDQTQKKVTLDSLRINIFKGLVLRNLSIYDSDEAIVSVKEVSCIFVWNFAQKKIIIPAIRLNSCRVFLERRKDGTFNILNLVTSKSKDTIKGPDLQSTLKVNEKAKTPSNFSIEIYKISIVDSTVNFKDSSFNEPFNLSLNNVDINVYLSLPASLRFKGSAEIPWNPRARITSAGEFKILKNELDANISIKNLSPDKFAVYYQPLGIGIKGGLIDAEVSLELKGDAVAFESQIKASGIEIDKDKMSFNLNSQINALVKYKLNDEKLAYSGKAVFTNSSISGLDLTGPVKGIDAVINFENDKLISNNIAVNIWDLPIKVKFELNDFKSPRLSAALSSDFDLAKAQSLIKDKFNFALPGSLNGKAALILDVTTNKINPQVFDLAGQLDVVNAVLKLDKVNDPINEINGRFEFASDQVNVKETSFKFQGITYKLSGLINNFKSPVASLGLLSDNLVIQSNFNVNKNQINIFNLSGRYFNSDFNASGNFDISNSKADISGTSLINLEDLAKILPKSKEELDKIMPRGNLQAKFNFSGAVQDIKSSLIDAQISSPLVSLYGLKGENINCYYKQQEGIMEVPLLNFSFYGGSVDASAKISLNSENLPYSFNLAMQGVKVEELKLDTGAKDKDIAGIIQAEIKATGMGNDLSKLAGAGNFAITKGRLWELNIFKGLGKILFSNNFAQIVFHEGSCSFIIQDSYILTKDLMLKSNAANLSGTVKLGFNGSIDALLNIDILENIGLLNSVVNEAASAVIGRVGKIATINITGTLSDPKYKLRPVVENIIKGLADIINKNVFKK